MAAINSHYPMIETGEPEFLEPANTSTPPDGFDPARDGAATWLALRMRRANTDET